LRSYLTVATGLGDLQKGYCNSLLNGDLHRAFRIFGI
jgi:hypothetical protein